ncbi:chemotaxis protein CheA [Jannaschia aquimarina]|uniref:Chemotaxis protein CheA n=1 Tax=Jannaschia aquimarina TaxID=935700 RepID=A0A0D1EMM2_9RHOB|nr:chemotaxis protein CheA [Jannaschia aquimarina]KIT16950.1 Chemotaxis protein CheA [Jannaschia aquimarina]SNT33545.1 two-component system, chemotaxis family, sensor kinase CheA [Jannaschia aquimarina]
MTDALDELRSGFYEECEELIEEFNLSLERLDGDDNQAEDIASAFRAVHSIKGGAAIFGMDALVDVSHQVETLLDIIRSDDATVDVETTSVLKLAADHISSIVFDFRSERAPSDQSVCEISKKITAHIEKITNLDSSKEDTDGKNGPQWIDETGNFEGIGEYWRTGWQIDITARRPDTYPSTGPEHLFRALRKLGEISASCIEAGVPNLTELDPKTIYASWQILVTPATDDIAEKEISKLIGKFENEYSCVFKKFGCSDDLQAPRHAIKSNKPPPQDRDFLKNSQSGTTNASLFKNQSTRVALEDIDLLVNLGSEMLVSHSQLSQILKTEQSTLNTDIALEQMLNAIKQQQGILTRVRAVQIRPLFQRIARVAEDAAIKADKLIEVKLRGDHTRIDKSIIERLVDPLTHVARNAVDHGIEKSEIRRRAGKSPKGQILLSATQESDRIIIEVSDDGRGFDYDEIRRRAYRSGITESPDGMSDQDLSRIAMRAGFSTKDDTSELSGRGVGLDVVHDATRALGGNLTIRSNRGVGASLLFSLPLTLSVLDGMLVRAADSRYIIPLSSVDDAQTAENGGIRTVSGQSFMMIPNNELIPIFDLSSILGTRSQDHESTPLLLENDAEGKTVLTLVPDVNSKYAVCVDEIESQVQVVSKPLSDTSLVTRAISGAAILGDGDLVLVVDAEGLFDVAHGSIP